MCPVGVAKVGAFPFFLQRKDKERRGGETLNPTRPTKERKKALLQKCRVALMGERERDVFDETPKERERSTPRRRLLLPSLSVYYYVKKKAGRLCFQRCFDDDDDGDDDDDDDIVFSPWGRM